MVNYAMLAVMGGLFYGSHLLIKETEKRRYHKVTGRNLERDMGKYHRSYAELLSYFQMAEPHKLNTKDFPEKAWQDQKGFLFGYDGKKLISIRSESESNIAVFGPPGTGKTSGLAIINAMNFEGSVLAIDVKGDIYRFVRSHTDREILKFCPDDPDALKESAHFNPFQGIKEMDETERKLHFTEMAMILIPDEGGSDGNYFSVRARRFFIGIAHLLYEENLDLTFPELIHKILGGNATTWIKAGTESRSSAAREFLSPFKGNNEKNLAGAYDNLCTALTPFSNPVLDELLSGAGGSISVHELEVGKDIYLQIKQEHLSSYAPLFTLLLQTFSRDFMKRADSSTGEKNRPVLMLLDEFPALTYSYDMISGNLSTLRSKSVVITLIQQNYAQLQKRYGDIGARSLIGNCNYQVILGSNDVGSSRVFSEMFGKRRVLRISTSLTNARNQSSGRNVEETEENVFSPSDFGDLPNTGEMILYFKGKYVRLKKLNCYLERGNAKRKKKRSQIS